MLKIAMVDVYRVAHIFNRLPRAH